MKIALIGYTGFVGSNLLNQYEFTACYNSKNIQEIHGKDYDLCICVRVFVRLSGLRMNSPLRT